MLTATQIILLSCVTRGPASEAEPGLWVRQVPTRTSPRGCHSAISETTASIHTVLSGC